MNVSLASSTTTRVRPVRCTATSHTCWCPLSFTTYAHGRWSLCTDDAKRRECAPRAFGSPNKNERSTARAASSESAVPYGALYACPAVASVPRTPRRPSWPSGSRRRSTARPTRYAIGRHPSHGSPPRPRSGTSRPPAGRSRRPARKPDHIRAGTALIPSHICAGTGLGLGTSAPGRDWGSLLPHRHQAIAPPSVADMRHVLRRANYSAGRPARSASAAPGACGVELAYNAETRRKPRGNDAPQARRRRRRLRLARRGPGSRGTGPLRGSRQRCALRAGTCGR